MEYPKHKVIKPLALVGTKNGQLPDDILENIPGIDGTPTIRLLKDTSARAWKAMAAHAARDGIILSATSLADSYRPLAIQERIWYERYVTHYVPDTPAKSWAGKTWWKKPRVATAAIPGTSNHGEALAVDNKNTTKPAMDWLLKHAADYGWSWELDSEKWHLHYFAGDRIPKAVLDYEASQGSNTSSEDDDMISGYDKSPEDVARATIRELCDTHWGKHNMSADEQTFLLAIWKDKGREAMMVSVLDNKKNKS